MNFENKANELRKKAERVSTLETIYQKVEEKMNWDCMNYHPADDEHEEAWFTTPEESDWNYESATAAIEVYREVLAMIEKLADK